MPTDRQTHKHRKTIRQTQRQSRRETSRKKTPEPDQHTLTQDTKGQYIHHKNRNSGKQRNEPLEIVLYTLIESRFMEEVR